MRHYDRNENARNLWLEPNQRMICYPETFDPDKLTVNEIDQGNGLIIAKIPQIPGRIARRKKANDEEYYIELILSRHYDPETRQNRNKKVIIGRDVSYTYRGMMIANENYHDYFDTQGDVLPHIAKVWAEEEEQKQKADEARDNPATPDDTDNSTEAEDAIETENAIEADNVTETEDSMAPDEPEDEEGEADEVQIKELREKEQALEEREQELIEREQELDEREQALDEMEKELENQRMVSLIRKDDAFTDHIQLLRDVLGSHYRIIEVQAKRRPDSPMSLRQIRSINEILAELQELFEGNEIENLLHLAEEPDENGDKAGTTYAEMAITLNAYESMLHSFAMGRLREK